MHGKTRGFRSLGILKARIRSSDTTGMTGIFSQLNLLGNALRGANQNHGVIAQNIANINTPGYKTQQLDFDQLVEFLQSPEGKSQRELSTETLMVPDLAERVDGNNVDLEREISQLKKNALLYQAYSQLMSSKLDSMRRAMST